MKKIKFVPSKGLENILAPTPLKNHIPQWYKDGETYDNNGGAALKTCVPFLDAMLSGYVLTTWEDLRITQKGKVITIEDGDIQEDGSFISKSKQHDHGHKTKGNQIKSIMVGERTSTRIQWFSILSIAVLLVTSIWQIIYLRRFFTSKKLL